MALAFCIMLALTVAANTQETGFTFHGFTNGENNLTLEGAYIIKSTGLLRLTKRSQNIIGHAFYSQPFQKLNVSFSTSFVFAIIPSSSSRGGHGLAFTIAPQTKFPGAAAGHFLGLFNSENDGNETNHIFAVEFDTVNGYQDVLDTEGDHVGINVNGMSSNATEPAAYYVNSKGAYKEELGLESGYAIQAWIDYDGANKAVTVTIARLGKGKPNKPLLNHSVDLSEVLMKDMYVGFSSSTGEKASSHYILGWSFSANRVAPSLNISLLPDTPPMEKSSSSVPVVHVLIGVISAVTFVLLLILGFHILLGRHMQSEILEDWEMECPHRFIYRDLHKATKGFKQSELIGVGGFGSVYKGVLPTTGNEVAVKRIVRSSNHGVREFAAEIESLGRLRHKNLVNLQGWCKHKNDLLLVYDYICNGSLDALVFKPKDNFVLKWEQRLNIIKGIATGLVYLHEEWDKVVIHRDVKSSNVLIDGDMNPRLSDFGLARLYDHGQVSHNTNIVGTIGYIAPELARTGKASTSSDVYSYGVLLLEVASGKRPIGSGKFILVDWVIECHEMGRIVEAVDPNLNSTYVEDEVELVLKLGLLCTRNKPDGRPTMRQVTRYLHGDDSLPDIGDLGSSDSGSITMGSSSLEVISNSSIPTSNGLSSTTMTCSFIQSGR